MYDYFGFVSAIFRLDFGIVLTVWQFLKHENGKIQSFNICVVVEIVD